MKHLFKFSRPKGPGFGLSKNFYLSVLVSRPTMPAPRLLVHPRGDDGAMPGFLVPLAANATKAHLDVPMSRGVYALSAPDRKTVLRVMFMPREEAGFDPEAFARSARADETSPEAIARLRGTWSLLQMTFESHDPDVYPSLDFLLTAAGRFATVGEGVVADPLAERYRLPTEIFVPDRRDARFDARDHVAVRLDGGVHVTRGLRKFDHPELAGPDPAALESAAQAVLGGRPVKGPLATEPRWDGIPTILLS